MLSAVCIPCNPYSVRFTNQKSSFPVVIEQRSHPCPFRTRQLSSASPMILRGQLRGKVGRRRDYERPSGISPEGLSLFGQIGSVARFAGSNRGRGRNPAEAGAYIFRRHSAAEKQARADVPCDFRFRDAAPYSLLPKATRDL